MSTITRGSGNVFADLGLSNPRERQAKAMIARFISRLIDQNGWTQAEVADRMGLKQPDVSSIVNGRLKGYTLERLLDCVIRLGQEVEIGISPGIPGEGATSSERFLVHY